MLGRQSCLRTNHEYSHASLAANARVGTVMRNCYIYKIQDINCLALRSAYMYVFWYHTHREPMRESETGTVRKARV